MFLQFSCSNKTVGNVMNVMVLNKPNSRANWFEFVVILYFSHLKVHYQSLQFPGDEEVSI